MRAVSTLAGVVSMALAIMGTSVSAASAQAPAKTAGGMDPDQAAVHDFVLTVDKCERYAAAVKKLAALQAGASDPATAAEMQRVAAANVSNVEKADMMAKSPHVAALFKTLNITPREFVLIPLTVSIATSAAQTAANAPMQAAFSYITPAQKQFVKDHQGDLEKWGLK